MTDAQLIEWLIFGLGFLAGYGLGYGRGKISGIRWCTKQLDETVTADGTKGE